MDWGTKGGIALYWAILLALALHTAVVICWTGLSFQSEQPVDEQSLWINVYVQETGKKSNTAALIKKDKKHYLKAGSAKRYDKDSLLGKNGQQVIPLPTPISNVEEQRRLRAIERKLDFYWSRTSPGEQGKVVLRIKVDRQGDLLALWVLHSQGNINLSKMVVDLVKAAAPFQHADGPGALIFDCSFVVR